MANACWRKVKSDTKSIKKTCPEAPGVRKRIMKMVQSHLNKSKERNSKMHVTRSSKSMSRRRSKIEVWRGLRWRSFFNAKSGRIVFALGSSWASWGHLKVSWVRPGGPWVVLGRLKASREAKEGARNSNQGGEWRQSR